MAINEIKELTSKINVIFEELLSENNELKEQNIKLTLGIKSDKPARKYGMMIEEMELSPRALNCLVRRGFMYVYELTKIDLDELMKTRNLGVETAKEISDKLKSLGLKGWDI